MKKVFHTVNRVVWLSMICVGYIVAALIYSITIPAFEVSDELWHYPMVDYLASNGLQLPVQNAANVGAWRQEGSQPPLYYMMSAILVAGIDRSDLQTVRRINPHADIGIIRPDGNANMLVRALDEPAAPMTKTLLAVHVVRWFSILLGLGTVLVTYGIGRELFPDQPVIALGAAGVAAFLPMFMFISASVNNDNLSNLLGNLLTLLTIRLLKRQTLPGWRVYVVLGIVMGCGLLAKLNLVFWLPMLAGVLFLNSIRLKNWRSFFIGGGIIAALTTLIAGWWYVRNGQLYGDPTGLNVFLDIVGRRAIPANAEQLWSERFSFTHSFWGLFGGMNVPMSNSVYTLLDAIAAVGLFGAVLFILTALLRRKYTFAYWMPLAITIIWPIVTFVSLLRWTTETPASQGRLIFGALSSIALWLIVGWTWWQPKRVQPIFVGVFCAGLAGLAVAAPFVYIQPAYAAPMSVPVSETRIARFTHPNSERSGTVDLTRITILTTEARPESDVSLELDWQVVQPFAENWSLFVHLVSEDGVIVAQRDVFPGQGRIATSDLAPGFAWRNPISIMLPENVYAPGTLSIEVGWYESASNRRLVRDDSSMTVHAGIVQLLPRMSDLAVPNPISINFDRQIELVGYSLSALAPQAGESVELTLYWRRMRPVPLNYTVFAHIVDPATQTLYAGSDSQPAQGNRPTSTWVEGEIITDTHNLPVQSKAAPGIYELEIGIYTQTAEASFSRLRVVTADGGMANDYAYLSRIRIAPFSQ